MKLQKTNNPGSQRIDPEEEELKIGQWYWVSGEDEDEDEDGDDDIEDEDEEEEEDDDIEDEDEGDDIEDEDEDEDDDDAPWIGCIVHVGSNYAKLEGVRGGFERIHLDHFNARCKLEPDADSIIKKNVEHHRENVRALLNKVRQLTARLGIAPDELKEENTAPSTALAVASGTNNIKEHKAALIKAKDETLPELFGKIKLQNERMATWMKAQLIPLEAECDVLEASTDVIKDRIFTVELYAGLTEELVLITDGKPAPNDTKVSLFQRRHYMDEECLARYEAGGMGFDDIGDFDEWLVRDDNRTRLLPHERCVVAFRVRRHSKARRASNITEFIRFFREDEADALTFLYIRNGEQTYRMSTEIDFGEQLFPDRVHSTLLGNNRIWARQYYVDSIDKIITDDEYQGMVEDHAQATIEYEKKAAAWKAMSKKEQKASGRISPWRGDRLDKYVECNPKSVFYDDAMKMIARAAHDHNRVAVVLQGLLDRSPAFHPHPPWQLWKPEGFAHGIELIYDDSRALVAGDKPDFKAYRAELGKTITRGTMTIGQEIAWEIHEAKKENDRRERSWRYDRNYHEHERYRPYGNPGPGTVAKVVKLGRTGKCTFEWERERQDNREYRVDQMIQTRFVCPGHILLNVDAYKPGDFKIFYADPRTRAEYMKWAPFLLGAEDYIGRKKKKRKKRKKRKKQKESA